MLRGARGSRVRTRGGLSRGSYISNTYSFRSDSNTFEVLSSMPQDGDAESFSLVPEQALMMMDSRSFVNVSVGARVVLAMTHC